MSKKTKIAVSCVAAFAIALLAFFYIRDRFKFDLTESNIQPDDISTDVLLSVYDINSTKTGATVQISNTLDEYITDFGVIFGLDLQIKDTWYIVPKINCDLAYTMEGYTVFPGETQTYEVSWLMDYGELPAGHYRFVKPVSLYRLPADKIQGDDDGIDWRRPDWEGYLAGEFDID